jgi:hypothetical protein
MEDSAHSLLISTWHPRRNTREDRLFLVCCYRPFCQGQFCDFLKSEKTWQKHFFEAKRGYGLSAARHRIICASIRSITSRSRTWRSPSDSEPSRSSHWRTFFSAATTVL